MDQIIDRNASIDITCPKCANKISETLGRIQDNPDLVCAQCGGRIDAHQFAGGLNEAEEAIRKFMAGFK